MKRTYRTKEETVAYFRQLSFKLEREAHRSGDLAAKGKAEAYDLAAFEVEHNMKN